jgi:hypothetical protein
LGIKAESEAAGQREEGADGQAEVSKKGVLVALDQDNEALPRLGGTTAF